LTTYKDLTGFRFVESMTPGELQDEITSFDHPYTSTLPRGGLAFGTDVNVMIIRKFFDVDSYLKNLRDYFCMRLPRFSIAPRFTVDDRDAVVLGMVNSLGKWDWR